MDQDYPEAVWLEFIPTGTMQTETIAELNAITRSAAASGGNIGIDRCPLTVSNIDSINFAPNTADTDYDQTFQWVPEASGKIDKFFINIATMMHIESISGGSATFDSMTLTITRQGGDDVLFQRTFPTGIAARTGDEDLDLFIVSEPVWGADMKIRAGNPLNIRIQTTITQVATVSTDTGLCNFFPQQTPSGTGEILFFGHSGIMWYISRDQPE